MNRQTKMKNLRKFLPIFIIGMLASITMVSCLDDNNDNNQELTEEQKATCASLMRGNYTGKLLYYNKANPVDKDKVYNDSIEDFEVRINYPERSIVAYNFPVRLLFKQLSGHDDMKEAAKDLTVDLRLSYEPYALTNSLISYYMKEIKNVPVTLSYGGETHTINVYFLQNTIGEWKDNKTAFILFEYGLAETEDKNGTPNWIGGEAFYDSNNNDKLKDARFVFSNE